MRTKNELVHGIGVRSTIMDNLSELDIEDKTFIAQNFIGDSDLRGLSRRPSRKHDSNTIPALPGYNYDKIQTVMNQVCHNFNLDMFFVAELTNHPMVVTGSHILQKYGLYEEFSIDPSTAERFIGELE